MRAAIITGNVAPYANRLYETCAREHGIELEVFECASNEPARKWVRADVENYKRTTLSGLRLHKSDIQNIYFNPSVIPALWRSRPDAIIISAFSPTMILAGLYAIATRTPLGLDIDGSLELDPGQTSFIHGAVRRFLAKRSSFATCSSDATREMKEHWGLRPGTSSMVPHMGSWDAPTQNPDFEDRPFDLLFCGTLNERKNPDFFAKVVEALARNGHSPTVRVIGDGPLREQFVTRLNAAGVSPQMDGYLQSSDVIKAYQSAKIVLFPTLADTWGLVANEALMCGTPIVASPHAVSSPELVARYETGLVLPLDVETWASKVEAILLSRELWTSFMKRRAEAMEWHSVSTAAAGLACAIRSSSGPTPGRHQAVMPSKDKARCPG